MRRLLIVLLVFSCATRADDKQKAEQAVAILAKAASSVDIRSTGPLRLHIKFKMQAGDYLHQGDYVLLWQSESKWRDQLTISNYRDLRVGVGGQVYTIRNMQEHADLGMVFRRTLYSIASPWNTRWKVKKIKDKPYGKQRMTCLEGNTTDKTFEECFDAEVGVYLGSLENQAFSDFRNFRGKLFPHVWRTNGQGVNTELVELEDLKEAPTSLFDPPKAVGRTGCFAPTAPVFKNPSMLKFPNTPLLAGGVQLLGVVREDGTYSDVLPLGHAMETFETEVRDAAKTWRFQPATCGGKPVSVEAMVGVFLSSFGTRFTLYY